MLENSRMTQTDQEIAGSARFFRSLLGAVQGQIRIVSVSAIAEGNGTKYSDAAFRR